MKKALAFLLAFVLLLLTGCGAKTDSPKNETGVPDADTTSTTTTEVATDFPEDNSVLKPQFDDNVPLFATQDRADIEGDRSFIYYYNHKGDLLKSAESMSIGIYAKNGLAPAIDPVTYQIGFVDYSGVFVIEPHWDDAASFSDDGFALVIKKNNSGYGEKYGFINEKGELVVPCIYDGATSFYPSGVSIICVDEKVESVYTDENGEEQKKTETIKKMGVIDKEGKVIIQPQYYMIDHIEGNYIICSNVGSTEISVYDLSGKVLIEKAATSAGKHQVYKFYEKNNQLYRDTVERLAYGKFGFIESVIKTELFTRNQFIEQNQAIRIEVKRAATTSTGYAYGVVRDDEVVIPFQYDLIMPAQDYFVAMKFQNGDIEKQLIDIYNSNFEMTATNLEYNYHRFRTESFGVKSALPSGYFDVYVYDAKIEKNVHGIINASGEVIIPFLFYRNIAVFTYEGGGGYFSKSPFGVA